MNLSVKCFLCLLWIIVLYTIGILLFAKGFLLMRLMVEQNSTCDVDFTTKSDQHGGEGCWTHKRFDRAVILIIDALRYDFAAYNYSIEPKNELPHQNKLKFVNNLLTRSPQNARLYHFIADPPTTTMQRLKGLTTGSLPTFVDAGSNFASTEITEDNILDQLLRLNKRITFIGDDTWMGLFPNRFYRSFPYPSLNVKDLHTVDNGVIEHLIPEMKRKDWDVLIGHFLGVDHCGHRYGPNHPAMAEKLAQMDSVIRSVVKQLEKDTMLFVLGDHGMTRTGDHGGDSWDELDAAMFVYSPAQITASTLQTEPETVSQIDLVPTLSLLLGAPIPFSNLGCIIPDFFNYCPWWKTSGNPVKQVYHSVKALRLNAHQVRLYLQAYSQLSEEFPVKDSAQLESLFANTEGRLQEMVTAMSVDGDDHDILPRFRKLQENYLNYLQGVKHMCQSVWAKFDLHSMVLGLSYVGVAFLLTLYLYAVTPRRSEFSADVYIGIICSMWFCILLAFLHVLGLSLTSLVLAILLGAVIIVSMGLLVYKLFKSHAQSDPCQSKGFCRMWSTDVWTYFTIGCMALYFVSFFSNSYVVFEDDVTSFLLMSCMLVKVYQISVDLSFQGMEGMNKKSLRPGKFDIGRLLSSPRSLLFLLVLLLCGCVRVTQIFQACREEQWTCEPSHFQQSLSAVSDGSTQYRNLRYLLSISTVISLAIASRVWMRKYGNLNGHSPAVICALHVLPASVVCVCFFWAIQALPSSVLDKLPVWQHVILPQGVYIACSGTVLVLLVWPLCLYLVRREGDNVIGLYGTSEENVLPKVYNHIRINWKKHFSGDASTKPPLVYGLATVYSASLILLVSVLAVLLMMLLGDGMAPSLLLQLATMFLYLELHASHQRVLPGSKGEVLWPSVFTWCLIASQFFFATGHQMTVTTVRWEAAFTGFHQDFQNYLVPAALIVLNMFASHVLCAVAAPLLLLWPYTQGHLPFIFDKTSGNQEESGMSAEERKGEFVLSEDYVGLRMGLYRLLLGYVAFLGCKLLATVCAAGLHRRHLMVWKIFAPRLVFEGATFFVATPVLLLVYLFVLRIDSALSKWVQAIEE